MLEYLQFCYFRWSSWRQFIQLAHRHDGLARSCKKKRIHVSTFQERLCWVEAAGPKASHCVTCMPHCNRMIWKVTEQWFPCSRKAEADDCRGPIGPPGRMDKFLIVMFPQLFSCKIHRTTSEKWETNCTVTFLFFETRLHLISQAGFRAAPSCAAIPTWFILLLLKCCCWELKGVAQW